MTLLLDVSGTGGAYLLSTVVAVISLTLSHHLSFIKYNISMFAKYLNYVKLF